MVAKIGRALCPILLEEVLPLSPSDDPIIPPQEALKGLSYDGH